MKPHFPIWTLTHKRDKRRRIWHACCTLVYIRWFNKARPDNSQQHVGSSVKSTLCVKFCRYITLFEFRVPPPYPYIGCLLVRGMGFRDEGVEDGLQIQNGWVSWLWSRDACGKIESMSASVYFVLRVNVCIKRIGVGEYVR